MIWQKWINLMVTVVTFDKILLWKNIFVYSEYELCSKVGIESTLLIYMGRKPT